MTPVTRTWFHTTALLTALCTAAPAQSPTPDPSWAGPVEEQLALRFGADGNAEATGAKVLPAEGDTPQILDLQIAGADSKSSFAANTMIRWSAESGMALGPKQFLSFEIYVETEKTCQVLVQLDELLGDDKLRGLLAAPKRELGTWQTVTLQLLRNELYSDRRIGSKIMPDRTPLTGFGLKVDPRRECGVKAVRVRGIRLYRQDPLAKAPVEATDAAGQTALHYAAMVGDAARVRSLLKKGADANAKNKYQYTPLAHAVIARDTDTVRALIEGGADVGAQRQLGFTALYDAAAEGLVEIMDLLLEAGADPTQKTQYGFEPLFTAVHHGHIAATERLLADDRVDVNRKVADFMPLHVAAQGDDAGPHSELYERMIELGARVDPCSAAAAGDLERLRKMVEQDASAAKAEILGGWTPLHDAARNAQVDVVQFLLDQGADPNKVSGDIDFRSVPMHWVGAATLLEQENHKLEVMRLLFGAGAKLDILDKNGLSPLDQARRFQSTQLAQILQALGAKTGKQILAERKKKGG